MKSSEENYCNLADAGFIMSQASVSVVIPCYRCSDTVERAVSSVAAQSLRPFELILVDDGSGDRTLPTLHAIRDKYGPDWVKVIELGHNQGVSVARNTGWDAATQEYVAFLDADDAWHPDKIFLQFSWMKYHSNIKVTGHRCIMIAPNAILPKITIEFPFSISEISKLSLLLSNPFNPSAAMLERTIPYRYDSTSGHDEDSLLLLQIGLDGNRIAYLNADLAYVIKTLGKTGASRNLLKMRFGNIRNYWKLWRNNRISFLGMGFLILYSFIKGLAVLLFGYRIHYPLNRLLHKILYRQ